MPTEAEFVASLANLRKDIAVPVLEASEQAAKAVQAPAAPSAAPATELPPLPASYPPLEAGASK
jgi:outer membrane protein assembly factor BamE